MRTRALRIPPVVLAWVAMLWVGFTATPLPHHCEMAEPAAGAPVMAHHPAGHHRDHDRGPAPGTTCHCVGHACCASAAAPASAGGALPLPVVRQVAEAPVLQDRLVSATHHLLPFPLGPPALPRA